MLVEDGRAVGTLEVAHLVLDRRILSRFRFSVFAFQPTKVVPI